MMFRDELLKNLIRTPLFTSTLSLGLMLGIPGYGQTTQPSLPHATSATDTAAPEANIRFQFDGLKYNEVLHRFSKMAGKPLIGEVNVPGELTFFDAQPYTYNDALDTLNIILASKQVTLIEDGRHLKVVPLKNIAKQNIRILTGLHKTEGMRSGEIVTVVLPLKYIGADIASKAIQPMISDYGNVAPLGRGKGVVITDRLNNIKRVRSLIMELDSENIVERRIISQPLKFASAKGVAQIINTLFGSNSPSARNYVIDPKTNRPTLSRSADPTLVINATADDRTNTIIIAGTGDKLIMAQEMIQKLDVKETQAGIDDTRVFELKNAKAVDIAKSIQKVLPKIITRDERNRERVEQNANVVGDAITNRVIVSAPVDQMPSIEKMITELDKASGLVSATRSFRLKNTQARDLVNIITNAVGRRDASGKLITKLAVSADNKTNTLIISGPPTDIEAAGNLINELENAGDQKNQQNASMGLHIVQLDSGNADKIAASLKKVLAAQSTGQSSTSPKPSIESESESNSLLITATKEDWQKIQSLLKELQAKVDVSETVIFKLKHADARTLSGIINNSTSRLDENNRRVYPLRVSVDPSSNSLVLTGPETEMKLAASLIKELDVSGQEQKEREIHVVKLEAGQAWNLATTLRNLFRERNRGKANAESVQIEGDWSTNSLLIACNKEDWPMIKGLLEEIQAQVATQASGSIKVYPLKHASAQDLARALSRVYWSRNSQRSRMSSMNVVITAANENNAIIVSAPPTEQAELSELIKSMDTKNTTATMPLAMIRLSASKADELAQRLSRLIPRESRNRVSIQADPATNTILLRAPDSEREMLEKMIRQIDDSSIQQIRETKLVPLKFVSASALTRTLSQLHRSNQRGRATTGHDQVIISASPDDKTLVVDAPKNKLAQLVQLAKTLDTKDADGHVEIKTYATNDSNPAELAKALKALFRKQRGRNADPSGQPEPRFEADTGSGQLLVAATKDQFREIDVLIKTIMKTGAEIKSQTRIFTLKHADANEMVTVIREMITQTGGNSRSRNRGRAASQNQQPTRIAAVKSNNSVVAQASAKEMALIENIIANFDQKDKSENTEIQIITLKNANAASLSQAVNAVLQARQTRNNRRGQNPSTSTKFATVTAEPNSNALLVRGTPQAVADAKALIQRLDSESESDDLQVSVFTLQNARADELSRSLSVLFKDILRSRGRSRNATGPQPSFSVSADKQTNSLIVSTSRAYLPLVEKLISDLEDKAEKPKQQVQYFWLTSAEAFEVADQLDMLFRDRKFSEQPVIYADQSSNSLTVIGAEADIKQIEDVVAKMDESAADNNIQVRAITITGAKAQILAEAIKGVYSQMSDVEIELTDALPDEAKPRPFSIKPPGATPADQPATQPAAETADDTVVARKPRIYIAVDNAANTLVISAPRRELSAISTLAEELAGNLDKLATEIKTFKLENADPTVIAGTVSQLFRESRTQQAAQSNNRRNNNNRNQGSRTTTVVTAYILPDVRTRSLIVRAKPQDMDLIANLIKTLDQGTQQTSEVRIFNLENTRAEEVAENLREMFSLSSGASAGNSRTRRNTPTAVRSEAVKQILEIKTADGIKRVDAATTLSIAANTRTNAIVAVAPAEAMSIIQSVIQELDQSAADSLSPVIRLYPVEKSDVNRVAESLRVVFSAAGNNNRGRNSRSTTEEAPVLISTDPVAKVLVISAPADKHELVATVIADIEKASSGDEQIIKIYSITHADANGIASALNQTMQESATRSNNRRRGNSTPTGSSLRITADQSSNAILVKATEEDQKEIADLISQMDQPPVSNLPVQVIALKNAKPDNLATILNNLYTQNSNARNRRNVGNNRPAVVIEADNDSGMLLVRADTETFEKIKTMAMKLDEQSSSSATPTLIALKNTQAAVIAEALTRSFTAPRGVRVNPEDQVTIVAEPLSNSVIITAGSKKLTQVKELVSRLDSDQAQGPTTQFVLLQNARATELSKVLTTIASAKQGNNGGNRRNRNNNAGNQLVVTADDASNALLVTGPEVEVMRLIGMAKELDLAAQQAGTAVHIIALTNGDATDMARTVQDLYNQQTRAARSARKTVPVLAVTADTRANALVVSADKSTYDMVKGWVTELEKMKPARGKLRIINIDHANPSDVQDAIQDLYGGSSGGSTGQDRQRNNNRNNRNNRNSSNVNAADVVSRVLDQQKAILIEASDEDYEAIMQLVKTLDAAAQQNRRIVKLFNLKNAPNARVATALTAAYRQANNNRPQVDQVTVTALPQTNAIMVTAAKSRMEEVTELIEQLDQKDVAQASSFRIFTLKNATASKILPLVRSAVNQLIKNRQGLTVEVSADDRSKSLIVTAPDEVLDSIGQLINQLDQIPTFAQAEIQIFRLRFADASRLAEVLNNMLKPDNNNRVSPQALALQEQVRLINVKLKADGKEVLPRLNLDQPIKITPDAGNNGSNTLIVTSTKDNLLALEALIKTLDVSPLAEGVVVELFHLKNADANTVSELLKDIFEQSQDLAGKPRSTVEGKATPETPEGKGLVAPVSVAADERTNAIVISGLPESVALAKVLLKDLDRKEARFTTDVKVFKLKHADPEKLLPTLQAVFAQGNPTPSSEGLQTQVTRLRITDLKQRGITETDLPKLRPALTIQADAATRSIVVAALSDVMPLIERTITTLDTPDASGLKQVRVFPLEHASAVGLSQILRDLYTGANARSLREEDRPIITTDARTNSLVITANENTFALIMAMIKTLDQKTPIELREVKILSLKNAQASSMAPLLQQMMDERVKRRESLGVNDADSLRVIVLADARTNSLIVGGDQEGYTLVKELADTLDNAAPSLRGQVRIAPLEFANAGTLSETLNQLFTQRYAALSGTDAERDRPVIIADLRMNALMIAATADDNKAIDGLLKKLDVKRIDPTVKLTVIPLVHNDAGVLATSMKQIFDARQQSMTAKGETPNPQDRVDIVMDSLTNSLIISANKENLEQIQSLLKQIDVEPSTETGVVRLYPLKNTDANRAAQLLRSLIQQGLYKPGSVVTANNPQVAARERVAIEVDARTNSLIISASKENFAVFEEVLKTMDSSDSISVFNNMQTFVIKHADATRVSEMLISFFNTKRQAEIAAGATDNSLAITIIPDSRTNTLLVAGSPENINELISMLKQLDTQQVKSATRFGIFDLKHATASALQPTLENLFSQRVTRGQANDPITVIADARMNALIVGASTEDLEIVKGLIAQLDQKSSGISDAQLKTYPLTKAKAEEVVETINALFTTENSQIGPFQLSADERSNTIIVNAGPADIQRIEALIKKLDTDQVSRITEIRVYTLKNADATQLAEILNNSINARTPQLNGENNSDEMMQFITRTPDGKELLNSALKEGALFIPDARTNTLVVSAPLTSIPLLTRLINALDNTTPRSGEIRVFKLTNADASQMMQVLIDLFKLEAQQGSDQALRYTLVEGKPVGESNNQGQASTGSAEKAVLTVTVDPRTNSLLVGGTEQYITLAASIISELDSSPAQERMTHVYRLRNAQADTIETTIRSFLDQERQRLVSALGQDKLGAAQRLLDQEVAIVAENNTNTLLVSASPRYFKTVATMIEELDKAPPMVSIQVTLAEILLDDDLDFGFEWSFEKSIDDVDSLVQTSLDVAQSFAQTGGLGVTITSGDFSMQLQALKAQNKLEILSRPTILATDNQEATINVGQRVPTITNSRVTDNDNVINTISYEQVGVTLTVTPRINADGFVRMEINPEISNFEESDISIANDVNAIIFNNRSAETTVTVQNGHTIILGGLISSNDNKTISKVPLLGDIPGLGDLFKKTEIDRERRELLIILTPTVITNQTKADELTNKALKRQDLIRRMEPKDLENKTIEKMNSDWPNQAEPEPTPIRKPVQSQNRSVEPQSQAPKRKPRFIRINADGQIIKNEGE